MGNIFTDEGFKMAFMHFGLSALNIVVAAQDPANSAFNWGVAAFCFLCGVITLRT